eukprot:4829779-Amphidinium_carterae.1
MNRSVFRRRPDSIKIKGSGFRKGSDSVEVQRDRFRGHSDSIEVQRDRFRGHSDSIEVQRKRFRRHSDSIEAQRAAFREPSDSMHGADELYSSLARPVWSRADASRLAGRLNFFRSYVAGKQLAPALHIIHLRAMEESGRRPLTSDEVLALECVRGCVSQARPIVIKAVPKQRPTILYTDGAVEGSCCGYGAVLAMPGREIRVIKGEVPEATVNHWRSFGIKHCIAQVEMYPVVVAKLTWRRLLAGTDLVLYTDNESVKEALVKGHSANVMSRELLYRNAELDLCLGLRVWVSRVPSESNPADDPSRGSGELRLRTPWLVDDPVVPTVG